MTTSATRTAVSGREKGQRQNLVAGRGRGPKKGAPGIGRPKGGWKEFIRELREADTKFHDAIRSSAHDPESKGFGHVLRLVYQYDEDAPERKVSVKADTTLTVRLEYAAPLDPNRSQQHIGSAEWHEVR